ncbi:MAG: sensor histidine kinase [Chromatiales bacterium]
MPTSPSNQDVFLPDFCAIRTVFRVVIIAELLAIVIALASHGTPAERLDELALISLFIQWVALTCAAVLCTVRARLGRWPESLVVTIAYGLMVGVTWFISELTWWLGQWTSGVLALATSSHAEFVLRNLAISAIISALLLRYLYVQHHWQRRVKSESRARIEALQARIRPHFLFNCMNTIASLVRARPEAAEKAVEDLADLFRASLADARGYLRMGEELHLCRQYLDIESLRLGERLRVEWDVEELPVDSLVPALTLQPLIENAIYHGIEPRAEGGVVRVQGWRDSGRLRIEITNPLPVVAGEARHEGNRMAQENVRERLAACFANAASLVVATESGHYRVTVSLPHRPWDDEDTDRR